MSRAEVMWAQNRILLQETWKDHEDYVMQVRHLMTCRECTLTIAITTTPLDPLCLNYIRTSAFVLLLLQRGDRRLVVLPQRLELQQELGILLAQIDQFGILGHLFLAPHRLLLPQRLLQLVLQYVRSDLQIDIDYTAFEGGSNDVLRCVFVIWAAVMKPSFLKKNLLK